MLKRKLVMLALVLTVVGCQAENSQNTQQFHVVSQVNSLETEKYVWRQSPAVSGLKYKFVYSDPLLNKAYQQYLQTGKAANILTDSFVQFAYGTGSQPVISTSTLELTVISLEPGESVTNVSSGDPLRWSYSIAYSGKGKERQAQIMVKPTQEKISTDLVITTDKRLYTLKIVASDNGKYARNVRFWYPQDMKGYDAGQIGKNTQNEPISAADQSDIGVGIDKLNFAYSLSHSGWRVPSWNPIRVFDDGSHTYIQLPATISGKDIPALFVQDGDKQELVNYRYKAPYFMVDKVFKTALLVSDVGNSNAKVVIKNQSYQ